MDAVFDRREIHCGDYSLEIGDFCFAAGPVVPTRFFTIFQECESKCFETEGVRRFEDVIIKGVRFSAKKSVVLKRLDLMGYTSQVCRARLGMWCEQFQERNLWHKNDPALTPDLWVKTAQFVMENYSREWESVRFEVDQEDPTVRAFLSPNCNDAGEGSPMQFDGHGSLTSFRIFLELSDADEVKLEVFESLDGDITPVVGRMCSAARSLLGTPQYLPVIIIPEGSSDTEILQRGFEIFFPEVSEFFRPFSFIAGRRREKKEGGLTNTTYYLRAVSEIAPNNLLFGLYDNDREGVAAHTKLQSSGLEGEVLSMPLPALDWLKSYPVQFGAASKSTLRDVNGLGSTIEMFAGRHNLIRKGVLPPIVTKEVDSKAKTFQGQIAKDQKRLVQKRFRNEMKKFGASMRTSGSEHDDLKKIFSEMFRLVVEYRSKKILERPFPRSFRDEHLLEEMSFPAIF